MVGDGREAESKADGGATAGVGRGAGMSTGGVSADAEGEADSVGVGREREGRIGRDWMDAVDVTGKNDIVDDVVDDPGMCAEGGVPA